MPRGGVREGAGSPLTNPKKGKKEPLSVTVFPKTLAWIEAQAKKRKTSKSELVDQFLSEIRAGKRPLK